MNVLDGVAFANGAQAALSEQVDGRDDVWRSSSAMRRRGLPMVLHTDGPPRIKSYGRR